MKIFKHIETGHVVEEANPNHYSIYSRFGYEEICIAYHNGDSVIKCDRKEEYKYAKDC